MAARGAPLGRRAALVTAALVVVLAAGSGGGAEPAQQRAAAFDATSFKSIYEAIKAHPELREVSGPQLSALWRLSARRRRETRVA